MATTATKVSFVETVLKNISGKTLFFSFVPKHGKRLEDGETVTVKGDIDVLLAGNKRKQDALANALTNERIRKTVNHKTVIYSDVDDLTTIAVGDMLWLDTSLVEPASTFTWDTDLPTTQGNFKELFVGIALEAHASGDGDTKIAVDISPLSYYDFTCESDAHEENTTMAPAKHPTTDTLLSNKLDVALLANSIARVARVDNAATTTCLVRFQSYLWGHNALAEQ